QPLLRALLDERRVAGGVRSRSLSLEVEDVISDAIEEHAVVADDEYRAVDIAQVLLEPERRIEVEVVGRLVEQPDVGGRDELPRQTGAAALSAAQSVQPLRARGFKIEAENVQHRVDARAERVAALALEAVQLAIVPVECGLRRVLRQRMRLLGERRLERDQLRELPRDRLVLRLHGTEVAVLVQQRDAWTAGARDAAARRLQLPREHAEERRLARAVPADDAPAIAASERERHILEDGAARVLGVHAVHDDLTHAGVTCRTIPSTSLPRRRSSMRCRCARAACAAVRALPRASPATACPTARHGRGPARETPPLPCPPAPAHRTSARTAAARRATRRAASGPRSARGCVAPRRTAAPSGSPDPSSYRRSEPPYP